MSRTTGDGLYNIGEGIGTAGAFLALALAFSAFLSSCDAEFERNAQSARLDTAMLAATEGEGE